MQLTYVGTLPAIFSRYLHIKEVHVRYILEVLIYWYTLQHLNISLRHYSCN